MVGMADEAEIRRKYEALASVMDKRMRRLWAGVGAECSAGGIAERATGLPRKTIRVGRDELRNGIAPDDVVNVRPPVAGASRLRKSIRNC
jgi:hypothetical protein